MSAEELLHTCVVCGAEEGLDTLLGRMVTDDQMRHLVADVIHMSAPLGKDVVRYLRLFKPVKQRLRMTKAREVLAELLPDMKRAFIERKGRRWVVTLDMWRQGFEAVFESAEKGTLRAPLPGNAYLYEVLLRLSNQVEAKAEVQREQDRMHRAPVVARPQPEPQAEGAAPAVVVLQTVPGPQGPSRTALALRKRMGLDKTDSQEMPAEPDEKGSEA